MQEQFILNSNLSAKFSETLKTLNKKEINLKMLTLLVCN